MTIRVVVADDQSLVRTGFRMILDTEPDLDVVGEAADGAAAVSLSQTLSPDVVLMDIRMPGMDGIEATRALSNLDPAPKVVILTTFDLDEYVYDALRAGASGFLLKDVAADQLAEAVRTVAAGDGILAPAVTRRLLEVFVASAPELTRPTSLDRLTPREREVFDLLGRGLTNTEIGAELHISLTTVRTHVTRLLMKLELRDRVQAVVLAYESGIVRPGHGS